MVCNRFATDSRHATDSRKRLETSIRESSRHDLRRFATVNRFAKVCDGFATDSPKVPRRVHTIGAPTALVHLRWNASAVRHSDKPDNTAVKP
eukprot:3583028-Prymnesium_polylepis.1